MPVLVYTLIRTALFGASLGLLWWAGMRSWLAPLLAAFVAWALSYVLFRHQRDAAAGYLADRARRRDESGRSRFGARRTQEAALEDAADEAARRGTGEQPA